LLDTVKAEGDDRVTVESIRRYASCASLRRTKLTV
jgi:hypothetical protein